MIRCVLDTDTCVFWLRGHRAIEQRILQVGIDHVAISIVTAVERLCEQLQVLHTTNDVSPLFGRWKAQLEGRGTTLDDADVLIAAMTYAHGCTLITNNYAHFRRLPDLAVDNWLAPSAGGRSP